MEPLVHLAPHLQRRPVLLLSEHHPGRAFLGVRPEPTQGIPVEQQPNPLVWGLRSPLQDRIQELQVVFDCSIRHGLATRSGPARAPFPDASIPIPLGEDGRIAVLSEEPEEHVHGGLVVPPRMPALGGRDPPSVDVKELRQRERLGLGFCRAADLKADEPGGELVRLPIRASPVAVFQRPAQPTAVLAPLNLEQACPGIGEDTHPVPAPFPDSIEAPTSFRTSSFDSSLH